MCTIIIVKTVECVAMTLISMFTHVAIEYGSHGHAHPHLPEKHFEKQSKMYAKKHKSRIPTDLFI